MEKWHHGMTNDMGPAACANALNKMEAQIAALTRQLAAEKRQTDAWKKTFAQAGFQIERLSYSIDYEPSLAAASYPTMETHRIGLSFMMNRKLVESARDNGLESRTLAMKDALHAVAAALAGGVSLGMERSTLRAVDGDYALNLKDDIYDALRSGRYDQMVEDVIRRTVDRIELEATR